MAEHDNQFEASPPTSDAVPGVDGLAFVLVPSFLLGPETWVGVAEVLGRLGYVSVIAAPGTTTPRDLDHVGPWVEQVVEAADRVGDEPLVIVAHSVSCPRLPQVAAALLERGRRVHSIVFVNGRVPWIDGLSPVEADPPLREMIDELVRPDDYLPPWHRWWGSMILDMVPNAEIRDRVFAEARPVPRALFDQPVAVPLLPATVHWAFLATGRMYEQSYDRAKDLGWSVARLDGEHLHLVVDPVTVAGMILSLVGTCDRPVAGPDTAND